MLNNNNKNNHYRGLDETSIHSICPVINRRVARAYALEDVNTNDPIYVDTIAARTGHYYVLRWRADNPGMWHFHCHLLYHMQLGLQMVFNVAEERQPEPTDAYWAGQEPWPLSRGPGAAMRRWSRERRS